jgi:lipid-A-disaccharide synthase-like uncharacterized protein
MGWIDKIIANIGAMAPEEIIWLTIGFLGQFLFAMRFIIQWIVSEKKRDSVIPIAFWYFSIGGGAILLSYAIWRADPVIILGQSTGLFIYLRNLYFVTRRRKVDFDVPDPDREGMAADTPKKSDAVPK